MFRLPIKLQGAYIPLSEKATASLQEQFQGTRYLIIDEKSMMSLRQLHWIDQRCRQIIPSDHDAPFGGLPVWLFVLCVYFRGWTRDTIKDGIAETFFTKEKVY